MFFDLERDIAIGKVCCFGGGSGGGNATTTIPAYLQAIHQDWLDKTGTKTIETSVDEVMNAALGGSPFTGKAAYDPSAKVTSILAEGPALRILVDALSFSADYSTMYGVADGIVDVHMAARVAAYESILDAQVATNITNRFEAGVRDVCSIFTSAFIIGRALIEADVTTKLVSYSEELEKERSTMLISAITEMSKMLMDKVRFQDGVASKVIEANRISIVALKEQSDKDLAIDEADAKWDLDVFQHGANVMAAISGGTGSMPGRTVGTLQSALGGALAGASMGMSMGVPGAAAGAIIGGLGGLLAR